MAVFEIDTKELEELGDKMALFPRETKRAMVDATNRALTKIITNTTNAVQGEYPSVAKKDIKSIAKVKKAKFADMDASVTFTDGRLKASAFPHNISRKKVRSPVTLRIKSARVTSGSNPVMFGEKPGGSRGAKGSREIFKRTPGERSVETVYTLSIPQMVSNEEVFEQISKQAQKDFQDRFKHEFNYRIGKL